jgi:2-hydroxychromene-2-carboxylate isomerase
MQTVDFYFDFISPYAYLAWTQLPALCSARSIQLRYKPILFAGLLNHWGQRGPAEITPKREFLWKDSHRQAARLKVPFSLPRTHPFNPLLALRLAQPEVAQEQQEQVITSLWSAGWVQGAELSSVDELRRILTESHLDADGLLTRANQPEAKAALRSATEDAVRLGVFGVPTYLVNQEIFWGCDRLDDLVDYLEGKDPIDAQKIKDILANYSASADRIKPK